MVNVPWVWTGLINHNFDNALNWTVPLAPGTLSDCEIFLNAPTTIFAGNETINSLSTTADITLSIAAGAAFTLLGDQDLVIPTGVSNIRGTIALGAGADLNIDGKFNVGGALNTAANSDVHVDGAFVNTGMVRQNGDFTIGDGGVAGTVTNAAGATWAMYGTSGADILNGATVPLSTFNNVGTLDHVGAISHIGARLLNSGHIADLGGGLVLQAGVTNTGAMSVSNGTLVMGAVAGIGNLSIGQGGTLDLTTGLDTGQTVNFLASSGGVERLDLGHVGLFQGHITGFTGSDLIDVNVLATSESFAGGVLTLKDNASVTGQLHLAGNYTTQSFSLSSDGHSGTLIHFV